MNKQTEAGEVVEAEKGKNLSPRNLHLRLRVVEVVTLVSLLLNLVHWYVSGVNDRKIENHVDNISQQTGVRP
jgi:agmatine/peptidylarginine deiminase